MTDVTAIAGGTSTAVGTVTVVKTREETWTVAMMRGATVNAATIDDETRNAAETRRKSKTSSVGNRKRSVGGRTRNVNVSCGGVRTRNGQQSDLA